MKWKRENEWGFFVVVVLHDAEYILKWVRKYKLQQNPMGWKKCKVKFSQVNFQNCSNTAFKAFSVQTTWHKLGKKRKKKFKQRQHCNLSITSPLLLAGKDCMLSPEMCNNRRTYRLVWTTVSYPAMDYIPQHFSQFPTMWPQFSYRNLQSSAWVH